MIDSLQVKGSVFEEKKKKRETKGIVGLGLYNFSVSTDTTAKRQDIKIQRQMRDKTDSE